MMSDAIETTKGVTGPNCLQPSGSDLQSFRSQVMGEWADYYPKAGETCEYRIRLNEWIPCEIIREKQRNPTRYLARYISHTGQLKTGIVGSCNLRPSPQNNAVRGEGRDSTTEN